VLDDYRWLDVIFRWPSIVYWPPVKGKERSFLGDGSKVGDMALEHF
jgi:hypothetical protein